MSCCNDCGSSPRVQLCLVLLGIVDALVQLVGTIVLWTHLSDHLELILPLEALCVLLSVVIFWSLVGPRCCAPCLCGDKLPDVPHPCPRGTCSCTINELLDYPLMISLFAVAFTSAFGMLAEIEHVPASRAVQHRHGRVSDRAEAVLSFLNVSKPVLLASTMFALCAGWKKYLLLRTGSSMGTAQGAEVVVGQPIGMSTEKKQVTDEIGEGTVVTVNSEASPKVRMPAKDRMVIPQGFGMIELQNTSGEESAFEMVALLYENPAMIDGCTRKEHLQKKLHDSGCEDKMIVYVPESDLLDLKKIWSSREVQEARKNVMKETKQRAPRLSFFRHDGYAVQ
eukprot:TRINITY_DN21029_c0_g1_i1.p1 TRINITY_DN21029_c0_g1~~TRINITY_DN21029_c0_g1_i1.p1  ORF type:complete len:338 (-),score=53.23 TRINITY_DN21029_c0_g1_i1:143-1156(-)